MKQTRTKKELAKDITERLFGAAPLHLKAPQVIELEKLGIRQLRALVEIEGFPIPEPLRANIVERLGSEEILNRMEKRARISAACVLAEKEGLYEMAEHETGMLSAEDIDEKGTLWRTV